MDDSDGQHRQHMVGCTGGLIMAMAVITTYFNPVGYRSRRENYPKFRDSIINQGAELFTIQQMMRDDDKPLPTKGEQLVVVKSKSILWQKERLLNVLVNQLPDKYDNVCWVDCDLIMADPAWIRKSEKMLEVFPTIQPYGEIQFPAKGIKTPNRSWYHRTSAVKANNAYNGCPGAIWCARRSLLKKHGIYDAHIMGGSDTYWCAAVMGCWKDVILKKLATDGQIIHYIKWAKAIAADTQGQVGMLPQQILHLYHGSMKKRFYCERHQILIRHNFDPATDIRIGADGCYEWCSDKPELHREVEQQFHLRCEDE